MDEPCFFTLRTMRRIAYSPSSDMHTLYDVIGFIVEITTSANNFRFDTHSHRSAASKCTAIGRMYTACMDAKIHECRFQIAVQNFQGHSHIYDFIIITSLLLAWPVNAIQPVKHRNRPITVKFIHLFNLFYSIYSIQLLTCLLVVLYLLVVTCLVSLLPA